MPGLELMFFGPPRAVSAGVPLHFARHKTLALLAYLAVTGQAHGRDSLAALLWPEAGAAQARTDVRHALAELRQTTGSDVLRADEDRVALDLAALHVDVVGFRNRLARVDTHRHGNGPLCDECLADLAAAADLYRGDFLAGFTLRDAPDFDTWQTYTGETLRLELAAALEKLALAQGERRDFDRAIPYARRWLALNPLCEPAHRCLMRLHAAAGDRAAAFVQYEACQEVLARELGLDPEPETVALYEQLKAGALPGLPRAGAGVTGPAASAPHPTINLPGTSGAFIGREAELAALAERVADPTCRLLTILGPGGIGKTRLAVEAGRSQAGQFRHGVCFVDLAPVPRAELLSSTILNTLGVPQQTATELDQQLLDHLRDRHLLLVLDNYEHLLTGAEPARRDGYGLVTKLARAAPQVKVVITSRARLNVSEEWLLPLEGLTTPPVGARSNVAAEYGATALFLHCLQRLRPGFRPSDEDAQTIAAICRCLEGMPLAIELAAAWARVLPLAEIARRLAQGLDLLTTTLKNVPARQRSMVATFDHSWRLLGARERSLLRQLSVFRGGFSGAAAEAVAGATLTDLATLVDASWLRLDDTARYTVHELILQYCVEKLAREHAAETGELPVRVAERHAAYFCSAPLEQYYYAPRRRGVIADMGLDWANLVIAWDWAVKTDDLAGMWPLLVVMGYLADRRGIYGEAMRRLELGLQQMRDRQAAERDSAQRSADRAVICAGLLTLLAEMVERVGQVARAVTLLDEAVRVLGPQDTGGAHWAEMDIFLRRTLGWLRLDCGEADAARNLFSEALAKIQTGNLSLVPYRPGANEAWETELYWALGYCALARGDYTDAMRLAKDGISLAQRIGSELLAAYAGRVLVIGLLATGDYQEAERQAGKITNTFNAFSDKLVLGQGFSLLGQAELALGRPEQARTWFRRGLALARNSGMVDTAGALLSLLGDVELALGNVDDAERLYRKCAADSPASSALGLARVALRRGDAREALRLCRQILASPGVGGRVAAWACVRMAHALAETNEPVAAAELCGFVLTWQGTSHAAREAARELNGVLAERLGPEVCAAAEIRGAARTLADVIAGVLAAEGGMG